MDESFLMYTMAMSLIPQQQPRQQMRTVTIEEILLLLVNESGTKPKLENYFSPTRKEHFVKDYISYLNSSLLEMKNGQIDIDRYLVFVLTFQFIAPLLEIPAEKELVLFYRILEQKYDLEELDFNLHFTMDEFDEGMLGEEDALLLFRNELDQSYEGRRELKETVQQRLKKDGIGSIMKWQQKKGLPELAEAFGRCIVIPTFFSFTEKKLVDFYRRTTGGISYEVAVPDFEL